MASDFETFCDAVIADLQANVRALTDVKVHRLLPYDPEELQADGDRHLSVFPVADTPDVAEPLVTGPGGDLLNQTYRVLYWEDAAGESSRAIGDTEAAATLFELHNAIRARFYAAGNTFLGGTEYTRYLGSVFPDRAGLVRWFTIGVLGRRTITVS